MCSPYVPLNSLVVPCNIIIILHGTTVVPCNIVTILHGTTKELRATQGEHMQISQKLLKKERLNFRIPVH